MALEQWALAKFCGMVQGMEFRNFYRGRHLYSAGQPSRWPSDHILVYHIHVFRKNTQMFLCCCHSFITWLNTLVSMIDQHLVMSIWQSYGWDCSSAVLQSIKKTNPNMANFLWLRKVQKHKKLIAPMYLSLCTRISYGMQYNTEQFW